MIVLHELDYNPKIDYLICRNLVKHQPHKYDEASLRKTFIGDLSPTNNFEKDILKIKQFFIQYDASQLSTQDIAELYSIIVEEKIDCKAIELYSRFTEREVVQMVYLVQQQECDIETLFKILLLVNYCKYYNKPLIPYRGVCRELYWNARFNNSKRMNVVMNSLIHMTNKINVKHDVSFNELAVNSLQMHKDTFLNMFPDCRLGYCGSIALGQGNEYSDLDIVIVFPDNKNINLYKRSINQFWQDKILIPYDTILVKESEMNSRLTVSILRTLKYI
ncbi:MAG: nucleotidyltransferase domain-containing protein [Clostridiales bacterium]|nr:nucleotidyltransferase domain-containing protein [Clostridiales bacterium]